LDEKVFPNRNCLKYMAEHLLIPQTANRKEIYDSLIPQIQALTEGESDLMANLANISAALKEAFNFFWIGFYLKKENQLVLGPFQGPIACTRINFNRGVCGHCYTTKQVVIVPDVEAFPGHIACSSASKSEIVLPAFDKNGEVFLVLDIDSDTSDDFSEIDSIGLSEVIKIVEELI
jgi:L-methionine (R)-S-oxide reductase